MLLSLIAFNIRRHTDLTIKISLNPFFLKMILFGKIITVFTASIIILANLFVNSKKSFKLEPRLKHYHWYGLLEVISNFKQIIIVKICKVVFEN